MNVLFVSFCSIEVGLGGGRLVVGSLDVSRGIWLILGSSIGDLGINGWVGRRFRCFETGKFKVIVFLFFKSKRYKRIFERLWLLSKVV